VLDGFVPPLLIALLTLLLLAARRTRAWGRRRALFDVLSISLLLGSVAGMERAMGRTPTYAHGPIRLWSGDINGAENSQQLFDPYTFTHVSHGAVFYGVTRLVLGPRALMVRAILALAVEAAWEVYENTDTVINRYRAATIALGYYGDSIINSLFDVVACAAGFVLAWKLPTRLSVAGVIVLEVALAMTIRDNLTLNIVMLLHPVQAIRRWQLGG
jgi:Protein of unknown function (DUF2585)